MLALEARTSDDEMLESEASIGTADSSENLLAEHEGATSETWGKYTYIMDPNLTFLVVNAEEDKIRGKEVNLFINNAYIKIIVQ